MVWRFLDQRHVPLSVSMQVSERAVSCQYLSAADWRWLTVMLLMFLTVTFVSALPHSFSVLLCLSPWLTSFRSPFPPTSCFLFPFPFPILFPSFFPISPVQRWECTTAVKHQPWVQVLAPIGRLVAVVVKGPGAAPPSAVQVCSITYPTNNTRISTLSPRTQATPTAQLIQLWVQQMSLFSVSMVVSLSVSSSLFVPLIS